MIIDTLQSQYGATPHSVMWLGTRFLITVAHHRSAAASVGMVMGLLATYKYPDDRQPRAPREAAFRLVQPSLTIRDETDYGTQLRPGVMVSCGVGSGQELLTFGIPLKDVDGELYVTVCSHRFPLGEETVFHPTGAHSVIGKVTAILGETDISLMKLKKGIKYSADTFGTPTTGDILLTRLKHPEHLLIGERVYMDSPFSGHCDGLVSVVERKCVPSDEPIPRLFWITIPWIYIGKEVMSP
ncbi:hypothetical protein BDD12DRAFT_808204 [Trichophaea hybrida]|nr:hypothetical protein BDD12DRAFT_808204 [Trichophaea hybrida]